MYNSIMPEEVYLTIRPYLLAGLGEMKMLKANIEAQPFLNQDAHIDAINRINRFELSLAWIHNMRMASNVGLWYPASISDKEIANPVDVRVLAEEMARSSPLGLDTIYVLLIQYVDSYKLDRRELAMAAPLIVDLYILLGITAVQIKELERK